LDVEEGKIKAHSRREEFVSSRCFILSPWPNGIEENAGAISGTEKSSAELISRRRGTLHLFVTSSILDEMRRNAQSTCGIENGIVTSIYGPLLPSLFAAPSISMPNA
jgi:hypothetical protein